MKTIACILSLFFLAMAFSPCTDGSTCDEEVAAHQHDHSDDQEDACTPLCVCSCCGIELTPIVEEVILEILPATPSLSFSHSIHYTYSFASSVWHPPSFA